MAASLGQYQLVVLEALERWTEPAPWWADAACRGLGVELFFPTRKAQRTDPVALAACDGCPVRAECSQAGQSAYGGVWGGVRRKVGHPASPLVGITMPQPTHLRRRSSAA